MSIIFTPNPDPLPVGIETQPYSGATITIVASPNPNDDVDIIGADAETFPLGIFITLNDDLTVLSITGTPAPGSAGIYDFTIIARNNESGLEVEQDFTLIISVVCLAANTQILMADGTKKFIQDIQRGDIVAADLTANNYNTVAQLNIQNLSPKLKIDIVKFEPHSISYNQPFQTLLTTANHPIIYQNKRRPAKCFSQFEGVTHHNKDINVEDILPKNHENQYCVYDLQFENDGSFVANGVIVQSRSPRSEITPLSKDLYFNPQLYTNEIVWDTYDHPLPLDTSIINI